MTRRRTVDDANVIAEPAVAAVADREAFRYHDAFASRYIEWLRQVERIEATSLAGLSTLLQGLATRAASARTWAEWVELAGAGLQEAFDDAARTQGEWLSALMQCEMETFKMLLDLGQSSMLAPAASDADPAPGWFLPWMAGAGLRPVQIA